MLMAIEQPRGTQEKKYYWYDWCEGSDSGSEDVETEDYNENWELDPGKETEEELYGSFYIAIEFENLEEQSKDVNANSKNIMKFIMACAEMADSNSTASDLLYVDICRSLEWTFKNILYQL